MHEKDHRNADDTADRRDVADEIEIELLVERGVDRVRYAGEQERVSVGRRIHDQFGADIAGGTRPVLDDERLAEPLREPLADQACSDVGAAPRSKADDDAHRPRRVGLRPRDARCGRERGSAGGQM